MKMDNFQGIYVPTTPNSELHFPGQDSGLCPKLGKTIINDRQKEENSSNAKLEKGPNMNHPNHDNHFLKQIMNM